ncbi:glutamate racemase [Marinomonas agarivorans]|nr:glutamate racemase [Marinomonas agarivorans]
MTLQLVFLTPVSGGVTIAQCVEQHLPNEHLLYFADTLHAPYGNKSPDFIQQRVNAIADYFLAQQTKAIVIACNTATVNAIETLRQRISIPIIGVEPAIKPAVQASSSKKVGLLVTLSTAKNPHFLALVDQCKQESEVYIQPCPGLVELVEQGEENSRQTYDLLQQYLHPLLKQNIDHLVLGCTHYPMLKQQICAIVGNQVTLLDTALPVTKQLIKQLTQHDLLNADTAQTVSVSQWMSNQIRYCPKKCVCLLIKQLSLLLFKQVAFLKTTHRVLISAAIHINGYFA